MAIYSSEALSNEFLHVNSCDCQYLQGYDTTCTRPKGRVDYHILYIAAGCCYVKEDNKILEAPAGSVILYRPGEPQQYMFNGKIKSVSYYIHFSGTGCAELIERFSMSSGRIFDIGPSAKLETTLANMIEDFHLKEPYYEQFCHAHLMRILSIIGKRFYNAENMYESSGKSKIVEIQKAMHTNYAENRSVAYYAELFGMSESRFTHVFKEYAKVSPTKYLLNVKVQKAKELLENTDLSMAQIAEHVGIGDQNYFSRLFKQYVGCSPKAYQLQSRK